MPMVSTVRNLLSRYRWPALLVVTALAAFLLLGGWRWLRRGGGQYFTAPVEQGDLQAVVNATGTINAVTTVQVGSQASGMISELHADFNSKVTKGQVIARIDPALFQTRVLQAEADLVNAEAGVTSLEADVAVAGANREKMRVALREAELNLQRTLKLFEQGIASVEQRDSIQVAQETAVANLRAAEAQINQTRARLEQAHAQVKQRQAQREQARVDLQHTIIRAPIDGTVIARNVDVGQTVAASLQAPTLFTIAQDLTQMLVYAKTDESDVGRIRDGAEATFTVDSFPNDTFRGRVKQVRMNAYQVQNVVTYDTIIECENPDLKLLPGMTAYVTIPVASARDVVKIPNGALRFNPQLPEPERRALLRRYGLLGEPPGRAPESGTVQAQETPAGPSAESGRAGMRERWQSMTPEERAQARARRMAGQGPGQGGGEGNNFRTPPRAQGGESTYRIVWKLNPDNSLQPVRIKTGLTDFAFTAMLEGELKAGDKLVIGELLRGPSSPSSPMPGMRRF